MGKRRSEKNNRKRNIGGDIKMAIIPVSLMKIKEHVPNIYEAVVVASKRARKINDDNKLEFNTYLSTITVGKEDEFEERENPDQLKLAIDFEKREKAHITAIKELRDEKVKFRYKNEKDR